MIKIYSLFQNFRKKYIIKEFNLGFIFLAKRFGSIVNIIEEREIISSKISFLDFFLYYI